MLRSPVVEGRRAARSVGSGRMRETDTSQSDESPPRPRGGTGAGLSADAIAQRALELLDAEGTDRFTMRKLASSLDVKVGALYWHYANKEALFDAVVERVARRLDELVVLAAPSPEAPPIEQLRRHLRTIETVWLEHPSSVLLGARHSPVGAGRFGRRGIEILRSLGYDEESAVHQWRAMIWIVLGFFYVREGVRHSAHHRRIDERGVRYEVDIGDGASIIDTDELFDTILDLACGGVAADLGTR
jgi:TetR/AcrR family transcriptional regulator, tetracycline repressor protein